MTTETKMVYQLSEGRADMVALLGGKGAHVSEMARIGIPVPPGFVITTEASKAFVKSNQTLPDSLWQEIVTNVALLEKSTGKQFGGTENPLIVSVRSGAPVSMPGMMDTILNLGVVDSTLEGLGNLMGDNRPSLDAYRRFIQGFGHVVLGLDKDQFESLLVEKKRTHNLTNDYELTPDQLGDLIVDFKNIILKGTDTELSADPWLLLRHAIEAVFSSWNNPRAIAYRDYHGIQHDLGTGCVIMAMVFGNLGPDSGTGVLFSRSPATGENTLYGEFLTNAQGEDVVAGIRTPQPLSELKKSQMEIYEEIEATAKLLEKHYKDVQDIEFTIEKGVLYILQTRSAKRTATASIKAAVDFVNEGMLSKNEALERVSPEQITQILMPQFVEAAKSKAIANDTLVAQGLAGSPGAAVGIMVMDPDRAVDWVARGEKVVLARPETNPDDVHGIIVAEGVLTSRGGMTSHAAVVTRGLGKPCIVGCEELQFDVLNLTASSRGKTIHEGDYISIDGATGEVFLGEITHVAPDPEGLTDLNTLLSWADNERTMQVWGNADTPDDALKARQLGAEGIGLCRTEHMFFAEERLPSIQQLLTVANEASNLTTTVAELKAALEIAPAVERTNLRSRLTDAESKMAASQSIAQFNQELGNLERFQTDDFYGILKAMETLPVVIRLLDAPLHEFLPDYENLLEEVINLRRLPVSTELETKERELQLIRGMQEANPMLGHRGCRVGMTMPEVYEMQVRSIMTAACRLTEEGYTVFPEIMIPIVSHVNELTFLKPRLEKEAEDTCKRLGVKVGYKFGTMIEVPRAALTAGDIAKEAEFFSFGSNDLTQMTFAFSRDDAEGKFLTHYLNSEVLDKNPFTSIDTQGVGRLMRIATEEGRAANPDLEIGICGEHGGDPHSIAFCYSLGLNYVSASPYRVPVARLAAAQSALGVLGKASEF